tara:strand:+ start:750 stop:1559 length:810 start_codon:yes stop_codon:yes gene_type:complete
VPELPEVETIRRQLGPKILNRTVISAGSHESAKFLPARKTKGKRFLTLRRRGKYLLAELDDQSELVVHLGMTGQLKIVETENQRSFGSNYERAWWVLDNNNTIIFKDVRRFGRIALVKKGDYSQIPTLRDMGPEPFSPDLTSEDLWRRTKGRKQRIKTQLLSQRVIAGVGNIYADEALFYAGINPSVRSITRAQAERLLQSLQMVFSQAIEKGGTTLRDYRNLDGAGSNQDYLHCYGRSGLPCHKCGSVLRSRIIDARSTTWCPVCQKR